MNFLKTYKFESLKQVLTPNVEQFILNKIKKTELTDIFCESMISERMIRNQLKMYDTQGSKSFWKLAMDSTDTFIII